MKFNLEKIQGIILQLAEEFKDAECNGQSVCIGKIGDVFVSIEVSDGWLGGDGSEEDYIDVMPELKCID